MYFKTFLRKSSVYFVNRTYIHQSCLPVKTVLTNSGSSYCKTILFPEFNILKSAKHRYSTFQTRNLLKPELNKYDNITGFIKCNPFYLVPCIYFRTSEIKHFHPIVWVVFKPVLKVAAVLSGRGFRKWWKDLPKDKKRYFLSVLKKNRRKIIIAVSAVLALFLIFCVTHLEETPITGRIRFMAFTAKQLELINEFELQQIVAKLGPAILPPNHPDTRRVANVVNRILEANKDLPEVRNKKWGISVVKESSENAFVLPIGQVFVFSGMISLCTNDDQLAAVLAHEIAHCILNHGAENVSFTHLLDLISIAVIAAIWTVLPSDAISALIHWLYQKTIKILLELPYNRKIETEADNVGLKLAAKACFDVRESSAFWAKMAVLQKSTGVPNIDFLSTHPSHEKRSEYLDSIMSEALKIRTECGCPDLKYGDPRIGIGAVSKALQIARDKYFKENPKKLVVII